MAHATINASRALRGEAPLSLEQQVSQGLIEYIPFPQALVGKYQCHTQADLTLLRASGCDVEFADVATGVRRYAEWLAGPEPPLGGAHDVGLPRLLESQSRPGQ